MKAIVGRIRAFSSRVRTLFSRFFDAYGRHLTLTYSAYTILFSLLIFASTMGLVGLGTFGIFLAMMAFTVFHFVMVTAFMKKEIHPYQLLYHQRVKALTFWVSFFGLLSLLSIATIMLRFTLEIDFGFIKLTQIVGPAFILSASLFMVSATQVTYGFSYHKETRLCLRLILSVFAQIPENENPRMKVASKNLRWFRSAFNSCNSFLTQKPHNVELNDLQSLSDAIYRTAQLGSAKEVEDMTRNIEMALNSLGLDKKKLEFKDLMTALKYIKEKSDRRRRVSSYDLKGMYRSSTRLDRVKARIKSPLVPSIIAVIGLIIAIVQLLT